MTKNRICSVAVGVLSIAACRVVMAQDAPVPVIPQKTASPHLPAIDISSINPAFYTTSDYVKKKIAEGKQLAEKGKQVQDVLSPYVRKLKVSRGAGGTAEGFVIPMDMGGDELVLDSYDANRTYTPSPIPDRVLKTGAYPRDITFRVIIVSHPKLGAPRGQGIANVLSGIASIGNPSGGYENNINRRTEVKKDANASEVNVIKFAITDDED